MTDTIPLAAEQMAHPSAYDVTAYLDLSFLRGLPETDRLTLARLIARTAERSYRRGFQQGATIVQDRPEALPSDLHDWRYGVGTDISPWGDENCAETSLHRLHLENRKLVQVGLPEPGDAFQQGTFAWPPKAPA